MPAVKEPEVATPFPDLSPEEETALGIRRAKLMKAYTDNNLPYPLLDGMTRQQTYDLNEKLAITFIAPKANKQDTNFQSGTVRQKVHALLAAVNKKNLEAEYSAFDKDNTPQQDAGRIATLVLRKNEELDNNDEKRTQRQYELVTQGYVFNERVWQVQYTTDKQLNGTFDGSLTASWSEKLKEYSAYVCTNVLYGPGVYLGSMSTFAMEDQPFVFTVDVIPYSQAESIFGKWDRWKNVPKKLALTAPQAPMALNYNWRLTQVADDYVEIIKYQDKWGNELAIDLNGVPMLPVGFPLTAISPSGEYTITKDIFRLLHPKFPLGKSLCMELRTQVGIYDEMARLAVLKTQKSYAPPRANLSGRVLSSKMFAPSSIIAGIRPQDVPLLDEGDRMGINNGEVQMLSMLASNMDDLSVNKAFQGGDSGVETATQNVQIMQQSQMMVDLFIWSCANMEKKLAQLALPLLLQNWWNPIDTVLDKVRNVIDPKYRSFAVPTPIEGEGMGQSIVRGATQIPPSKDIYLEEQQMKKTVGQPVKIFYMSPERVKAEKYTYRTDVNPGDQQGSNADKLMFSNFFAQAVQIPGVSYQELGQELAQVWSKNPNKLFPAPPEVPMGAMPGQPAPGQPPTPGAPQMAPQRPMVAA